MSPPLPRRRVLQLLAVVGAEPGLLAAVEANNTIFRLTIRDKKFDPTNLEVPAGVKIELHVTNADAKPVEFESTDLRREKIIAPGQTAIIYVGPLRAGAYTFFDDFNPATRGQLIAR